MGQSKNSNEAALDVSIVLVTYNEEEAIGRELEIIRKAMDESGYIYEVIVVDDASTDGTATVVERYPWAQLYKRPRNLGSGASRKFGISRARGRYVAWTDADLSYPNGMIPRLVDELEKNGEYDQIVGARTSEQGSFKFLRVPAKWCIRKLAMFLTRTRIPDLNSGLRVFRREVGEKYLHMLPDGFSCVTTMTISFLMDGHAIKYVPISYHKRQGKSKFHPIKDGFNYLMQVIRMLIYFEPLRILLPLALFLLVLGAGKLLYDIFVHGFSIKGSTIVVVVVGLQVLILGLLADLVVKATKRE